MTPPKNLFINEHQLQTIFEFSNMPTIQNMINKNIYFHSNGEVLGSFYSGNDSEIIQDFRNKEYFFMLTGYYKPIGRIEVINSTIKNIPETKKMKLDNIDSKYNNFYVIFDISKAKIDCNNHSHEKLMVSFENLERLIYSSDIYTYNEVENRVKEESYCKNVKERILNFNYKEFPEMRRYYYYTNIFSIAKLTGVLNKTHIVFNEIDESIIELASRIDNLLSLGIEKQSQEKIENYFTVPYALERIFERIPHSNNYSFNDKMITNVKLIKTLISELSSQPKTLKAIDRYSRIDFMVNHNKSIVIDNFIKDIVLSTQHFNKWLERNYPIIKQKQKPNKSTQQKQRENVFEDYLSFKKIPIGSCLAKPEFGNMRKIDAWVELEDYYKNNTYNFSESLFDSSSKHSINKFFSTAKLCSFDIRKV